MLVETIKIGHGVKNEEKGNIKVLCSYFLWNGFFFVFYRTVMIRQDVFEGLACVWVLAR